MLKNKKNIINIFLSKSPPNLFWSKKSILSITEKGIIIHLKQKYLSILDTIQTAARKIFHLEIKKISLIGKEWDLEKTWHFWLGYNHPKRKKIIYWKKLNNKDEYKFNSRFQIINWVRDIINLSGNNLTPLKLASEVIKLLETTPDFKKNIQFKILKGKDLLNHNYMGIYTVGQSSKNSPLLLEIDYNPENKKEVCICLVGKGITFDSGGYNLKIHGSMNFMQADMGGAAILTGALALAIKKGLKKHVKLYLCCAENMINGDGFKVGDIINYRNKKTVEIKNTDAEGRLVLADGLIDASKQNPDLIIDAATLTGAARVAVGNDYHAIFSFNDEIVKNFLKISKQKNELFWRLPVSDFHRRSCISEFADLSNISLNNIAGASCAAGFLSHFVKDYKKNWLHIDCSANFQDFETEKWAIGAKGVGVITIANFLLKYK